MDSKLAQAASLVFEGTMGLATHVPQCVILEGESTCEEVTLFKQVHPGSPSVMVGPHQDFAGQWAGLIEQLEARSAGPVDEQAVSAGARAWEALAHVEAMDLFGREEEAGESLC